MATITKPVALDETLQRVANATERIAQDENLINDDVVSTNKTWSSEKIDSETTEIKEDLSGLQTDVNGKYSKPASGIPATDLADGVIPDKLPVPNKLTFTGAATGEFDGSNPLTINIPSGGGGGDVWESVELGLDDIDFDNRRILLDAGNGFRFASVRIYAYFITTSDDSSKTVRVGFGDSNDIYGAFAYFNMNTANKTQVFIGEGFSDVLNMNAATNYTQFGNLRYTSSNTGVVDANAAANANIASMTYHARNNPRYFGIKGLPTSITGAYVKISFIKKAM